MNGLVLHAKKFFRLKKCELVLEQTRLKMQMWNSFLEEKSKKELNFFSNFGAIL